MRLLYCNSTVRRLGFGLPAELWIVQAGIFLNYLGWGGVMPFEVIYLHDGRGFSVGVAGLVVGTVTGLAVVAAPVAGPVIDRFGARATAAGAGMALAAGYAGLAFAHAPWQAFVAAAAAGIGNGALIPSQSALLTSLVRPDLRHRATAVSRVAGNLGAGLGAALGGVIAAHGVNGFVALFLANAATYVLYVGILVAAVGEETRPEPLAGGYRLLLRDRAFVRLALTNVAVIAVGWGFFTWVVPLYAREELGVGPRLIGLLLLANAFTVVLAQIPVARLAEGRRRAATMALASLTFVPACGLVLGADVVGLRLRVRSAHRGGDRGRRRGVPAHDGADAARRRSRAAGPARPLHGGHGPLVVARPGLGPHAGNAAPQRLAAGGRRGRRRGGARRLGLGAGARAGAGSGDPAHPTAHDGARLSRCADP